MSVNPPRTVSVALRIAISIAVIASLLSACGNGNGGRVELNFFQFAEPSGALDDIVNACSQASGGRYTIHYQKLPKEADAQRQQMVRRLAAKDSGLDILGLDVTWPAEFAAAGWIREWTGENKQQAEKDALRVPLQTATWQGKLYAAPFTTNTQLLWYRSDLVPHPPQTWDEMISQARELAREGKPHYIEIQGAQYEGLTVWFNTMIATAGGSILTSDGKSVSLGEPAKVALQKMRELAHSPAADPSLSNTKEDQARLAMEAGKAAFELNYPFVYPSMQQNQPALAKSFTWTQYPGFKPGQPANVTVGGVDLAVSSYSKHPQEAFAAALCMRSRQHQLLLATKGGLPPTNETLYSDPAFTQKYPFAGDIQAALNNGSVRPQSPVYQNISIVIAHQLSPPSAINPSHDERALRDQISDALESKGLIP